MGLVADMRAREKLKRVADNAHIHMINRAREFIYDKRKGVKSQWVENLLKPKSFVPTEVCEGLQYMTHMLIPSSECIRYSSSASGVRSF